MGWIRLLMQVYDYGYREGINVNVEASAGTNFNAIIHINALARLILRLNIDYALTRQ